MTHPKSDLDALAAWEMGGFGAAPVGNPQPAPRLTEGARPVWPALEADLAALPRTLVSDAQLAYLATRVAQGRAKYGVELHTHDGRDPWQDAQEEIADLLQYLCRLRLLGLLEGREYSSALGCALDVWATLDAAKARKEAKP